MCLFCVCACHVFDRFSIMPPDTHIRHTPARRISAKSALYVGRLRGGMCVACVCVSPVSQEGNKRLEAFKQQMWDELSKGELQPVAKKWVQVQEVCGDPKLRRHGPMADAKSHALPEC